MQTLLEKEHPKCKPYLEIYPALLFQKLLIVLFGDPFCLEQTKSEVWIG